ncbi:MAG: UDP-galactopyranose mutase [Bacteroides sp.]|nr:UDP-galactopyranose mutase [Bacteroides sp.]
MNNKKPYDLLIVGSGLFGATTACLAQERGLKCLVVDRRMQSGGNIACENVEGINVHKYGAHIFHTNNDEVWQFVCRHADMRPYHHTPLAVAPDGKRYSLPFSMFTFEQLWGVKTPEEAQAILELQRLEAKRKMLADGASEPRNLKEQALLMVGHDIFNLLINGYTEKQWGRKCEDLPAYIIKRLPLRMTYDDRYFNDKYQALPVGGYNPLINSLLSGCDLRLGVDYLSNRTELNALADKIVFTGRIDEYFDLCEGALDYRSVSFDTTTLECNDFQGRAVVNYTDASVPYTRIIEHKHFDGPASVLNNPLTVVSREYSRECDKTAEAAYPINDKKNMRRLSRYQEMAKNEPNVIFGGRLAEYKYYDMAPVIEKAMKLWI